MKLLLFFTFFVATSIAFLNAVQVSIPFSPAFQFLTRISESTSTTFSVFNVSAEKYKVEQLEPKPENFAQQFTPLIFPILYSTDNGSSKEDPYWVYYYPKNPVPTEPSLSYLSENLLKQLEEYRLRNCTEIRAYTLIPRKSTAQQNGLVRTVIEAYKGHHNLILTPNDIWAAILTQLFFHVRKNPEEFSIGFENLEGFIQIEGNTPAFREPGMDEPLAQMIQEIEKNWRDSPLKNWILPGFSKKVGTDPVVPFKVLLKSKPEESNSIPFKGGIPRITLEGTCEQWNNVLGRLEKLKEFKLQKWYDLLHPVVLKFVMAKEGKIDTDFWKKMVYHDSEAGLVSGWITVFSHFDMHGNLLESSKKLQLGESAHEGLRKWVESLSTWSRLNVSDISSGIIDMDMKLSSTLGIINQVVFVGHLATEIKEDDTTLQPVLGVAMAGFTTTVN